MTFNGISKMMNRVWQWADSAKFWRTEMKTKVIRRYLRWFFIPLNTIAVLVPNSFIGSNLIEAYTEMIARWTAHIGTSIHSGYKWDVQNYRRLICPLRSNKDLHGAIRNYSAMGRNFEPYPLRVDFKNEYHLSSNNYHQTWHMITLSCTARFKFLAAWSL